MVNVKIENSSVVMDSTLGYFTKLGKLLGNIFLELNLKGCLWKQKKNTRKSETRFYKVSLYPVTSFTKLHIKQTIYPS